MSFKRLKSFALLTAIPAVTAALLACSGMAGLGGAPGGSNFAEQKDGSGRSVEDGGSGSNSGNTAFRPGDEGQPTGLNKVAGPEGGGTTMTAPQVNGAAYYAAGGDASGGYRPGSEGQVATGPNIFVGVAGLDGRTNCKRPSDVPWDELFPVGSTPTLYYWLSQEENGGYIPTGFMKPMNEYGRVAIVCQGNDDALTWYRYALLLASYTDSQGKTYRSEAMHITCPDIKKHESGEYCLTMDAPASNLMLYHPNADLLLENSGNNPILYRSNLLDND